MAFVITEQELEQICQGLLPGEQVLAVGLFEPYGALTATGLGAGAGLSMVPGVAGAVAAAATGFASNRGMAVAEHQPPWTAMAVTPTHVYAFDASDAAGLTATRHFTGPPYATWDRSKIAVHVSRHLTHFTMSVDDLDARTTWEYTGNQVYKSGGKLVAQLLTDSAG
ncbi:MAG: hypothetical protein R2726_10865 [Acidimicrobiales bacterium]